jgi:hypothetical protein
MFADLRLTGHPQATLARRSLHTVYEDLNEVVAWSYIETRRRVKARADFVLPTGQ